MAISLKLIDFLCYIMTVIAYIWLESKINPKKILVMTNNKLMQAISSISICILRHECYHSSACYLPEITCIKLHLRKSIDSICCTYGNQI